MVIERAVPEAVGDSTTDSGVDPRSDGRLMRQMIGGSEEALPALYDRHADAVFSAALRASGDRWIAADVVQETFLALWNRAELFDPSRGTLSAWLATIARNRAIDRLRSAARHERAASFSSYARTEADDHSVVEWLTASGELIGVAGPEPGPELALSHKETRASIKEALDSLDPVERRVIVLAYDGGLSQSEIATSLGWPIGTVKTRTRRALRHLRDRLERPGAGVPADATRPQRGARENTRSAHTTRPAVGLGECLAPC
jgi:RNA polymerase sigma-70 factor (ECF subfamily)